MRLAQHQELILPEQGVLMIGVLETYHPVYVRFSVTQNPKPCNAKTFGPLVERP